MGELKQSLALGIALASWATAAAEEKTAGADLKIVSEVAALQPGVPFTIALHIHHHPGFHTYWKNEGIVGVPTSIDWMLPKGFKAGPIQWPAPEVVEMATHPAHGYHRDVLLLVEITPPDQIAAESVILQGELTWMACSKTCHPGFGTRRITLPVNRDREVRHDARWAAEIAKERRNFPAPTDLWAVIIESKRDASPIRVRLRPAKDSAGDPGRIYFFSEDGQISSEPPQIAKRQTDGSYLIVAERSEFGPEKRDTLPGTLVASGSWIASGKLPAIRARPRYP